MDYNFTLLNKDCNDNYTVLPLELNNKKVENKNEFMDYKSNISEKKIDCIDSLMDKLEKFSKIYKY